MKTHPLPTHFTKISRFQQRFRDFTADFTGFRDFSLDFADFGKDFRDFGISRKISDFTGDFRISFEISAEVYEISVSGKPLAFFIIAVVAFSALLGLLGFSVNYTPGA